MGNSLFILQIDTINYPKKFILITKKQLEKKSGEIIVNYLSKISPYNCRENLINSLYLQIAEDNNLSLSFDYIQIEKFIVDFIQTTVLEWSDKGESINIDGYTTLSLHKVEDLT
jgi:glucose-6-phosphate 1-dehydrogenase